MGDSYNAGTSAPSKPAKTMQHGYWEQGGDAIGSRRIDAPGLKPKDLIGMPWMLAFALRADGWYLRQDVIWHKPAPMPESATDRCTKAHEYIFLLAKQPRYFYDNIAIAEQASTAGQPIKMADGWDTGEGGHGTIHRNGREKGKSNGETQSEIRNKRSVWTVNTVSFKGAHFATFPPDLIEPCILAGTSEEGCCDQCGAPFVRITENERVATRPAKDTKTTGDSMVDGNRDPERHVTRRTTKGWQQSCKCEGAKPVPCTVLDPFGGSGTTGQVAQACGCHAILIELNPAYIEMQKKRVEQTSLLV
jgi:hypothetical protein